MLLKEEVKICEVSEFFIWPYTQNRKLGNLENFFYFKFDSCCNLRCKNDKLKMQKRQRVN